MAKSSKPAKPKIDASVSDAVEVSAEVDSAEPTQARDVDPIDTSVDQPDAVGQDAPQTDSAAEEMTAEESPDVSEKHEDLEPSDERADAELVEGVDQSESGDGEPAGAPSADPEPNQTSNGFIPLLLGGVVAGAIGYGIATLSFLNANASSADRAAQIEQHADDIAALQAQIAQSNAPDLSDIEMQIGSVASQAADQLTAVSQTIETQLAALDARLLEVEKRPNTDGTLSGTALEAYQRELEDLRADLDAQQETVMSAAAQAEADLATAREEASRLEQAAIAQAEAAAARAALNRVATAVETGAPYVDALAGLDPSGIPSALMAAAETGVATTASLTEDFPAAARAALATARSEGVSDDAGGLGGFLRSQFDVRSTAPREGAGPDAVLSRAEAAVKEGRIADALAELEALPEVARAELTDWTARATERADVLDAIATLSETYN